MGHTQNPPSRRLTLSFAATAMACLDPARRRRSWAQGTASRASPSSPAPSEASNISLDRCNVHSSLSVRSDCITPTVEAPPPKLDATPPRREDVAAPAAKGVDKGLELSVAPEFEEDPHVDLEPDPKPRPAPKAVKDQAAPRSKRLKVEQMIHDALYHHVDEHYRLNHTIQDWDGEAVESSVVEHVMRLCQENNWTRADLLGQ